MEYIEIFFGSIVNFFYNLIGNYGVSIILFTLLIKAVLFPLDLKQRKSMLRTQKIQPLLNELQLKYANDKEKLNTEMMKLYKQYNISPMSGCLPMLIQLPIIFALYWVIRQPITYMMGVRDVTDQALIIVNFNDWAAANGDKLTGMVADLFEKGQKITGNNYSLYEIQIAQLIHHERSLLNYVGQTASANGLSAISSIGIKTVDFTFLGLNLADTPSLGKIWTLITGNLAAITPHDAALWLIPLGSGLSSFFSSRLSQNSGKKKDKNEVIPENKRVENKQADSMKTMMIVMPLISAWFTFQFPAALGLYWIISNLIQLASLLLVNKLIMPKIENEMMIKGEVINVKENRKNRKKR